MLSKVIRDSFTIMKEWALYRKSLRILSKQEWSIDFLIALLQKADKGCTIELHNGQNKLILHKNMNGGTISQEPASQLTARDLMDYLNITPESRGVIK